MTKADTYNKRLKRLRKAVEKSNAPNKTKREILEVIDRMHFFDLDDPEQVKFYAQPGAHIEIIE
ncbi:MAG: hypothetical protein Q4A55_00150 [Aerococcus sp.]|nr:hypothetical protein [Aerococcus sp.]